MVDCATENNSHIQKQWRQRKTCKSEHVAYLRSVFFALPKKKKIKQEIKKKEKIMITNYTR
jgi:hypothetical protein